MSPPNRCYVAGRPPVTETLVVVPGYGRAARADKEVQVRSLVGLQDVIDIQPGITPAVRAALWYPLGQALRQLLVAHLQGKRAGGYVELDPVAGSDQRKRAAQYCLWCDVQYDGAEASAAHPSVRYPDHVGDAALEQPGRQHEVADLRHARVALRARPAPDQHGGLVDREVRIPGDLVVLLDRVEHQRLAAVCQQVR